MDEKLQEAYAALQAAHDAGNTEDATQLADYISTLQGQQQTTSAATPSEVRTSAALPAIGGALGATVGTAAAIGSKGKNIYNAISKIGSAPPPSTGYNPRGSSVEESVQNWRTYADAQNEASKSVRRDSELHKRYPGFTRPNLPHLQPTTPTPGQNVLGHAANLGTNRPLTGLTAGANALDLAQEVRAGNPVQATVSGLGLLGSAAPYVKKLPKQLRGAGMAASAAAPVINRLLDKFTNPPEEKEEKAAGGTIGHYKEGDIVKGAKAVKKAVSGFLEHTPSKPNPLVGTRFDVKDLGGIAPSTQKRWEDYQDAMVTLVPYDATHRNKQILGVSGRPLTAQDIFSHGGRDYVNDVEHIDQGVGGASGRAIANRIQKRTDVARKENLDLGGSGQTIMLPSSMGRGGEDFAVPTWQVYYDLFKQAEHNPNAIQQYSDSLRAISKTNPKTKVTKYPFAEMANLDDPKVIEQFLANGDMRKAFIKQQKLKENQRILGVNSEDIRAALTDPNTVNLPRGYLGGNIIETVPGASTFPSSNITYNTNFAGKPGGHFDTGDIPAAVAMNDPYSNMFAEMQARYPNKPWQQVHDMATGALERRNEGVSQHLNEKAINRIRAYQSGLEEGRFDANDIKGALDYLKTPGLFAGGGSVLPDVSLETKSIPSQTGMPGVGYMQMPQGAMARLQLEKELEEARIRAGVSGMAMSLPGQHGVKTMPGQMDIGANVPVGPGRLDISARRSINPIPGRGHEQGINARYTMPFAQGGAVPHLAGGGDPLKGANVVKHSISQIPQVAQALEEYLKGNITKAQHMEAVRKHLPIRQWNELPPEYTDKQIYNALTSDKQPKALADVPVGMRVGNRLDIPAYTQNNPPVFVDTVHDINDKNKAISYNRTGHLKDVDFSSLPNSAVLMGLGTRPQALTPMGAEMGKSKAPIAMIKGTNVGTHDDEVRRMMAEMIKDPAYTQIGMDPRVGSQFYDKATDRPIWTSGEKFQAGPLVIVPKKDIETTDWNDPRLLLKNFPGKTYKKGGLATFKKKK